MMRSRIRRLSLYRAIFFFMMSAVVAVMMVPTIVMATSATVERHVINSDETGITLRLRFPDPDVVPVLIDGCDWSVVSMAGTRLETSPGMPQLPYVPVVVGIPATADIRLSIVEEGEWRTLVGGTVLPAPTMGFPDGHVHDGQTLPDPAKISPHYLPNSLIYGNSSPWPASTAEIMSTGFIRLMRTASVRVNPVVWEPTSGRIRSVDSLVVRIDFPANTRAKTSKEADHISFEETYDDLLVNADVARRHFRIARREFFADSATGQSRPAITLAASVTQLYKIVLQQRGFYRFSNQQLQAQFGINLSSHDPRFFRMLYRGEEIAIQVAGQNDGVFNSKDTITFYGLDNDSEYEFDSVYWLEVGGTTPGMRMAVRHASPASPVSLTKFWRNDHYEQNYRWAESIPKITMFEDHWFWEYHMSGTSRMFYFNLPNFDAGYAGDVIVRLAFRGVSHNDAFDPDHRVGITLNGSGEQIVTWDDAGPFETALTFSNSDLLAANNVLTISAYEPSPGVLNTYHLNWYEIEYYDTFVAEGGPFTFPLVAGQWSIAITSISNSDIVAFDITNPGLPIQVTSATVSGSVGNYTLNLLDQVSGPTVYFVLTGSMFLQPINVTPFQSANLHDPSNAADYLIITHDDFVAQANQLATYRAGTGYVTRVVTTTQLYDEFNHGHVHPQGIKDFLTYVFTSWSSPTLTFVVFIGDATTDPKHYQGFTPKSYIPTSLFITPIMGLTTNDHWFSQLVGSDDYADIHLGRLPVQTANEAQLIVDKIVSYENYPAPSAAWNSNVIFIADNTDDSGCFECSSELLISGLPAHLNPLRVYLTSYANGTACRTAFIEHLNSDTQSSPLVNYFGHGGITLWANEQIFRNQDIQSLTNGQRLPFFISMSCFNNYFATTDQYSTECIGELLVQAAPHGAIGMISSTGYTYMNHNEPLDVAIFDSLFSSVNRMPGPAYTAAKNYMVATSTGCPDEVKNTVLLGDPAINLAFIQSGVPELSAKSIMILLVLLGLLFIVRKKSNSPLVD